MIGDRNQERAEDWNGNASRANRTREKMAATEQSQQPMTNIIGFPKEET